MFEFQLKKASELVGMVGKSLSVNKLENLLESVSIYVVNLNIELQHPLGLATLTQHNATPTVYF